MWSSCEVASRMREGFVKQSKESMRREKFKCSQQTTKMDL